MKAVAWLRASWRGRRDAWLLALAALALAATFLNPGLRIERRLFEHVVVLDITQSMNVTDQVLAGKPASRLAFAKEALRQGLLELPCGSKVGWAVFTEYRSFLLLAPVEVCANLGELRATLARIDGRMAWSGNSEVSKGLHSAIGIARDLPGKPSLVFITDGQEAPPLNPQYRPAFDDKPGEVPGLLVGVGELLASPIPKTDPLGRPLGVWRADEVMQTDMRRQGRGASVSGEALADDGAGPAVAGLGATPGTEHLSALREGYLRLLASERGLRFHRLQTAPGFSEALTDPALAKPVVARADGRVALAALAFLLLLLRNAWPAAQRMRQALRKKRSAAASAVASD
ncbi:vWA domain-containing protein [Rhizobacter sp. OV335]|jgi:mxaL protein|uniref:vWA domain-containing protein n=1 Tax=Rhizobacter sp. OV335 TaxID=1500264 RepID=UPI0009139AF9|nr:vWA domain-containing protein [Rhizobacter sp. OV335]SHN25489.1 mxaL protein [Rhizobacter sp. OV335]